MVRGHRDRAIIVGGIARSHVDRVKGRAAGQGFAHDGKLEHRASVRVAGDEALEARIGAGTVGVDRRSEERRVGKECVSTCRAGWSTDHLKKKPTNRKLTQHETI